MNIPERRCDLVMKGGITSGVVYPLAIVELSQEFRFKNVGGTSAGAIAAALTAAAEYRRVASGGSREGFDVLAGLPDFLKGKTDGEPNLLNLFPPRPAARRLFALVLALLGTQGLGTKIRRALIALLRAVPLGTLLAVLMAGVPFALWSGSRAPLAVLALVLAEAMALASGLLLVSGLALLAVARLLPAHGFGFGTGLAPADRKLPGVTDWLHAKIQQAAGRGENEAPLTFGDLWAADVPAARREDVAQRAAEDPALRAINLQMITTALSHGRPYRLPFETRAFFFDATELAAYFPAPVMTHLLSASGRLGPPTAQGLRPLPAGADQPVVVAARLSLSFPLLFSMVPLHAVDYTLHENQEHRRQGEPVRAERCWFVDGGLSSNFPVTLFDAPLPRWPTFCINLADFHPDHPQDPHDESKNVWMAEEKWSGLSERWLRLPPAGLPALARYVTAMLSTIIDWHDNTQLTVPGYRDRIAHVKLSPQEGGLNLDMDEGRVASLSQRGFYAGQRLRRRFGAQAGEGQEGLNWNTHRWTRLRSTLALFQKALAQCAAARDFVDPAYPGYPQLIARTADADPHTGYPWPRDPAAYQALIGRFLALGDELAAGVSFEERAPLPRPELHINPRL
jgi:predicted acylesterase/phospholipase RssA